MTRILGLIDKVYKEMLIMSKMKRDLAEKREIQK